MIANDPFVKKYATFLHTTPSHTPEAPRARCVFLLNDPIYSKEQYAELAEALVWKFQMADGACKDPARFFYGAKDCDTMWLGNSLDHAGMDEILVPYREHVAEENARLLHLAKTAVIIDSARVPDITLQRHSDALLKRVIDAPDGKKHNVLRNIATVFGGYVASGYYDISDVRVWLQNAIRQNTGKVDSFRDADKTIDNGLRYGAERPLYFQELDSVDPPLLPTQKTQVTKIIQKREWELYHRILKDRGFDIGYPTSIVDHFRLGYRERTVDEETGVIVPRAVTVPYGDTALEFREQDYRAFEYDGSVGLYQVVPMIEEESYFGLVVPDSILAINCYLSGSGNSTLYGLPHTGEIQAVLPDTQLYCIIDGHEEPSLLELLDSHGAKFTRVQNVSDMVESLGRDVVEKIATKGKPLSGVM
jgi:hypothetical protein